MDLRIVQGQFNTPRLPQGRQYWQLPPMAAAAIPCPLSMTGQMRSFLPKDMNHSNSKKFVKNTKIPRFKIFSISQTEFRKRKIGRREKL